MNMNRSLPERDKRMVNGVIDWRVLDDQAIVESIDMKSSVCRNGSYAAISVAAV